MATYLLVHGAWGGAWCWADVARRLRQAGHDVFAPDLTGLGARAHLAGQHINLSTHIQDVVAVLNAERLEDVILVGHSYGGMVVTGAASREAPRIRTLVYLDAFLPSHGQALWDLAGEPGRASMLDSARLQGGMVSRPKREYDPFRAETRFVTQSIACFVEGVQLSGAEAAIANRAFIWASRYDPSPFGPIYRSLQGKPGWRLATIDTGHNTMLEDPAETARLLLREAA